MSLFYSNVRILKIVRSIYLSLYFFYIQSIIVIITFHNICQNQISNNEFQQKEKFERRNNQFSDANLSKIEIFKNSNTDNQYSQQSKLSKLQRKHKYAAITQCKQTKRKTPRRNTKKKTQNEENHQRHPSLPPEIFFH